MTQAVSRRPVTAEARVLSQVISCEIYDGHGGVGTGVSPIYSGFRFLYHYTNAPHSSLSTCCSYQKDKRAKPGNLPKGNVLSETGEHRIEKYFPSLSLKP
jgi:hypothetical protein